MLYPVLRPIEQLEIYVFGKPYDTLMQESSQLMEEFDGIGKEMEKILYEMIDQLKHPSLVELIF